ncbi:hypothetical protein B0919_04285 [Hymenobacter sp. CRA2]|nr:hypothetical protein B0919_04285 [Hymenobacter sp. CRA2]
MGNQVRRAGAKAFEAAYIIRGYFSSGINYIAYGQSNDVAADLDAEPGNGRCGRYDIVYLA